MEEAFSPRLLGYAGHKTAKECLPPSLKPGDTLESLDGKYSNIARQIPRTRPPTRLNFVAVSADTFRNVKQGDYHVPDKRGISVKFLENAPVSKAFAGRTMLSTEIRAASGDMQAISSIQEDALRPAFDTLADNEGLVDARKIKLILASGLNNNLPAGSAATLASNTSLSSSPPKWIVDKFAAYYMRFGSRPDGLTDWAEFTLAFRAVTKSCRAEAGSKPVGFPEWIKEARKLPRRSVTVMEDTSAAAAVVIDPKPRPFKRPYPYPRSDLLLTYHNNMPGYTGYFPSHSLKSTNPRDFSKCPLTSQGAGFLGLML